MNDIIDDYVRDIDEFDRLRKATGGLDPVIVACALNDYRILLEDEPNIVLDNDELAALRAATFEVAT